MPAEIRLMEVVRIDLNDQGEKIGEPLQFVCSHISTNLADDAESMDNGSCPIVVREITMVLPDGSFVARDLRGQLCQLKVLNSD